MVRVGGGSYTYGSYTGVICLRGKTHHERNPDMVERIKKGFPDGQRSNFLRNVDSCRIDI